MTTSSDSHVLRRVGRALADIRKGRMVILTDDETRENEGDLVLAAEKVTPHAINFMAKYARGLICLSLTEQRVRQLNLPLMVQENGTPFQTAFTVSIEAASGVTTGISAADRARTIRVAVAEGAGPADIVRPGHIFPLRARDGGVLVRTGQTEGSVDLARMAGMTPAGVICEIMNDDGTMARRPQLARFAARHRLTMLSVADIVRYRLLREPLVRRVSERVVVGSDGTEVAVYAYQSAVDAATHYAIVKGHIEPSKAVMVRVHRAHPLIDILGLAEGAGALTAGFQSIWRSDAGVFVYLDRRPSVSEALALEAPAPNSRDEQSVRELGVGAQILRDVGVRRLTLYTRTPKKLIGLESFGLTVVSQRALQSAPKRPAAGAERGPLRRRSVSRR